MLSEVKTSIGFHISMVFYVIDRWTTVLEAEMPTSGKLAVSKNINLATLLPLICIFHLYGAFVIVEFCGWMLLHCLQIYQWLQEIRTCIENIQIAESQIKTNFDLTFRNTSSK